MNLLDMQRHVVESLAYRVDIFQCTADVKNQLLFKLQ